MYGMGQVRFTRDMFLKHLEYLRERREELQLCSTGSVGCMKEGTVLLKTNGKIEATVGLVCFKWGTQADVTSCIRIMVLDRSILREYKEQHR